MCDYSLESVTTRGARVGEPLILAQFENSFTRGFSGSDDPSVAVCLRPGTELKFERDVECDGFFLKKKLRENIARFRHVNVDDPHQHHDALEFPSGKVVLLTRLCLGQCATVLQLPAAETLSNDGAGRTDPRAAIAKTIGAA
jgi:hypothetical protein